MKSLFSNHGPFEIDKILNTCEFLEDGQKFDKVKINNVSNLIDSQKGDIVFFESQKYVSNLSKLKASYCLINKKNLKYLPSNITPIFTKEPLLDFILITKLFYPEASSDFITIKQNAKYKKLIAKNTFIDKQVTIGKNFSIGYNSTIKNNVFIGNNVYIGSGCVISNTVIGNNVKINHGTVIGKIGFGFKKIKDKIVFIPHIGHVVIGDNVCIGSNCTIDRGSFSNTVLEKFSMLDNQVHIAHNVKVGSNTIIAGQVGIAGSSTIGDNCMIGGQAGISGHLKIGNNVQIGGGSGVLKNLEDNGKVIGYPAKNIKEFLKK